MKVIDFIIPLGFLATSRVLYSSAGKLTEGLTVFELKDGILHSRVEINWFESGNTALEAEVCEPFLLVHNGTGERFFPYLSTV